jgi:exodeoxyribonuclease V beta subunit
MNTLDPLTIPLKGLNLIEASAGTGKTYAISNIYLQLLVEGHLSAEEILVVTFTKAATDELKGRIRGRIVGALTTFSGNGGGDDFLNDFMAKATDRESAHRKLMNALRSFDLAAIFTIHGFCLRMLHNHAFESASLFDTGLIEDQTEVLSEIVDDFWRRTFYPMDPNVFKATAREISRKTLLELAKKCVSNPLLAIVSGTMTKQGIREAPDSTGSSIVSLRRQFIDYVRRESARRKRAENVRSYDDLLMDLFRALEGTGGKELARSIQRHYKAALVDEFQDTDPLQYKIFREIYGGSDGALFLIGDPKQSIYSFRGADIFSYMEAVNDVDTQYTLGKNWRSAGGLIRAVNTIFGEKANPFVFTSFTFQPVEQGDTEESWGLVVNGTQDRSPFKIWFMKRQQGKKNIAKGIARTHAGKAVADEIVTLLSNGKEGRVLVYGRPIHAGDIAVLVSTNWEAREMLRVLQDARVPGVIYSSESIFGSHEAMEIERILIAVLEPANESNVKAALATDMMGVSGDDLAAFLEDERTWDGWVETFESYRSLFMSKGFIAMARTMITRERIKQRVRAFPDGERRVTNILHCVELLHGASIEKKLGPEGLLKWFQENRIKENDSEADEYQIRLETDEKAVKIVTIHKSKGLEYPIVFCPFFWGGAEKGKSNLVVYHDRARANEPTIDIGFPANEDGKRSMEHERLAELIRLLYVTLTRAKYRCYLVWGAINGSETSALVYLLHYQPQARQTLNLAELKDFMNGLNDGQMEKDIERLVEKSEEAIELMKVPVPSGLVYEPPFPETETLKCREFSGDIEIDWRTTSFSSIVSGRDLLAEAPDRDKTTEGESPPMVPEPGESGRHVISIFDFPRGARAGTCLHDIFEHIDFSLASPDDAQRLITEKLSGYGFDEQWSDLVYETVVNVLSAPIMGGGDSFSLSHLTPFKKLHEVEFYAPLDLITASKLGKIYRSHRGQKITDSFTALIEGLAFKPHKGMLRGFIDMIFHYGGRYYLVDWKSNFLGDSIEDYRQEKLDEVMEKELYILQYHIYAVALHQFLRLRVNNYHYHDHFGGVFYLFLRGINPERGSEYGVFFNKPEYDLINDLSHSITGACPWESMTGRKIGE